MLDCMPLEVMLDCISDMYTKINTPVYPRVHVNPSMSSIAAFIQHKLWGQSNGQNLGLELAARARGAGLVLPVWSGMGKFWHVCIFGWLSM